MVQRTQLQVVQQWAGAWVAEIGEVPLPVFRPGVGSELPQREHPFPVVNSTNEQVVSFGVANSLFVRCLGAEGCVRGRLQRVRSMEEKLLE
jgi:hypothetical protein